LIVAVYVAPTVPTSVNVTVPVGAVVSPAPVSTDVSVTVAPYISELPGATDSVSVPLTEVAATVTAAGVALTLVA
jgi:hypothetical protein